jgi:hypothetical protein
VQASVVATPAVAVRLPPHHNLAFKHYVSIC